MSTWKGNKLQPWALALLVRYSELEDREEMTYTEAADELGTYPATLSLVFSQARRVGHPLAPRKRPQGRRPTWHLLLEDVELVLRDNPEWPLARVAERVGASPRSITRARKARKDAAARA